MQLIRRGSSLIALLLMLAVSPAEAGICSLVVLTPGTLALSGDGNQIGSEEAGGISATMSVGSIGASTMTVSAPTVIQSPPGHNAGSDLVEVAYQGSGVLSSTSQPYTAAQTQVSIPNLIGVEVFTIDNRVTNTTGFEAGTYQTRTVITCS